MNAFISNAASFLLIIMAVLNDTTESFSLSRTRITSTSTSTSSRSLYNIEATPSKKSPSTSQLSMGLFDMFQSEEEREKNRLRKEAEKAEQERLFEEMRERRTNPEKMEEYEADVIKRRQAVRKEVRSWEEFEGKVGEDGIRVVGKDEE